MNVLVSHRWLPNLLVLVGLTALALPVAHAAEPGPVRFNRDIRPIMSDTCFLCHGPDKNSRKSGLRLDIREEALKPAKSGAIPIVPGKPGESEIIQRLFTKDDDDLMPPAESHKTITPAQKELFKRWVAEGAKYEPHWAYTPLIRPEVPKVRNTAWVKDPIDAFILEKLESRNITPSREADKNLLLRRLSLDLTGLPPTLEEEQAFLADHSKKAYERQVDRLLKSPHFGERMAVWWLDVARFTDTVGFHGDQNQRIFPYRDYVIDAFNQNKPFSQFTIEQLAGDLLPNPTPEQLVATGFNRLNMMTREGGAQPKEYLAKYGAERVRTIGTAFLGATFGCCECHDHKFDPIATRDFYSMQAFFADVKQWGVYSDYGYSPNPELKGWNNEYPFPPEIQVTSPYLLQREARLRLELADLVKARSAVLEKSCPEQHAFDSWRKETLAFLKQQPSGWVTPVPTVKTADMDPGKKAKSKAKSSMGKTTNEAAHAESTAFTVEADNKITFENHPADLTTVSFPLSGERLGALRLELLPSEKHQDSVLRGGATNSVMLKVTATLHKAGTSKETPVTFRFADADHKKPDYNSGAEVIGVQKGWKTSEKDWNRPQTSVWLLEQPFVIEPGDVLTVRISDNAAGLMRLSVSPLSAEQLLDPAWLPKFTKVLAKNRSHDRPELYEAYLASTAWNPEAFAQCEKLQNEIRECRNGRAWTMVTQVMAPLTVRVLPRGNWMDQSGAVVLPASPHFLPGVASTEDHRLTRLDLARWLCSKENPLTPRAVMNRLWKQFYGNGLSAVVDDLGAQGEPPSHPELLDWIAAEFRDGGWDMKHMIKLMVMSATYRQDSSLRPELRDIDPNNRLLSSQNPRRLDAEFVRDNALFIAGLLNLDLGGPSVMPYQPAGYYANIQFPNRVYVADTDDREWRRGVYMHWQRTFLHPMLANFDAPMRDECVANRTVSNTPQQALTLLNDPTFVEAARVFAGRLLSSPAKSDDARLALAYRLAVSRSPRDKELASLKQFLATQRDYFRTNAPDAEKLDHVGIASENYQNPVELAAWAEVCRVVLNLHETITRY